MIQENHCSDVLLEVGAPYLRLKRRSVGELRIQDVFIISNGRTNSKEGLEIVEKHPMKYFVGLGVDEQPPDHSSLTRFKERLLKGGGQTAYDQLLRTILKEAAHLGIQFGSVQIIDSVHVMADVNLTQDHDRQREGQPPRDPEAKTGVKRIKRVRDVLGHLRQIPDRFHGYKAHLSANADNRLITSCQTTPGNAPDNHHFQPLVAKDQFSPGLSK